MASAAGHPHEPHRAEVAGRESFLTQELEDAQVLQKISNQLVSEGSPDGHYHHIVEAARALMRSDAASIQELDGVDSRLKLLAHTGFHAESAAFWDWVDVEAGSSCGRALIARQRVVVPDMDKFEADPHDVAAYRRSGIRSVQSTPLVASSGRVVGVMSTHWNHPHTPSAESYRFFDILARLAADFMERARTEAALRESEARYRNLFETMRQGYMENELIRDATGRAVDYRTLVVNPQYERLTGIPAGKAVGRTARELVGELDPGWIETYDRIVRTGKPERFEREEPAFGRWFEVQAYPLTGDRFAILYDDITERRRTDAALRASGARLTAAFASVPVGIAEFGPDGKTVLCNAEFRRFLPNGMMPSLDPEHGRRWQAWGADGHLVPSQEYPSARALRGERVIPALEMLYTDDDGRAFWTNVATAPIFDGAGQVTGCISVISDITERKLAEAASRESEAKFRTMFRTMTEACCIFELIDNDRGQPVDWRILEANAGYERESGLKDVAGKLASEVMPGTEPYWIEAFGRVADTGASEQIEKWHQPTGRWIHSSTARVGGPGSRCLVSVFYDITERKQREQRQAFLLNLSDALRAEPDEDSIPMVAVRLTAAQMKVDRCWIAVLIPDQDRAVIAHDHWRPDLQSLKGEYRYSDFPETARRLEAGIFAFENIPSDATLTDKDKASFAGLRIGSELAACLRQGEGRVSWSFAVANEAPRHWTREESALLVDVAERTWAAIERARTEAALRESEALLQEADRRKNHFLAMLGHELRNPLAAIHSGSRLLASAQAKPESKEHALSAVREQTAHMIRLVDDLLEVTRIVEGRVALRKQDMAIQDAVRQALDMCRPQIENGKFEAVVGMPAHALPLEGDLVRLTQVFVNIIGNALKYSGDSRRFEVQAGQQGDEIVVRVRDFGQGITAALLPRIFDPFVQAVPGLTLDAGMGLGLAVVKELVRLHGGQVHAFSEGEGKGSEFVVRLPAKRYP